MGILIKGMDKPTRCSICKFEFWAAMGYQCLITEEAVNIKTCPLIEVEQVEFNNDKIWHTGTPTEEGWYLVAYKKRDCDGSFFLEYGARVWIEITEGEGLWNKCQEEHPVFAWQRIETEDINP